MEKAGQYPDPSIQIPLFDLALVVPIHAKNPRRRLPNSILQRQRILFEPIYKMFYLYTFIHCGDVERARWTWFRLDAETQEEKDEIVRYLRFLQIPLVLFPESAKIIPVLAADYDEIVIRASRAHNYEVLMEYDNRLNPEDR
jgi:hypothetical protein